MYHHSNVSCPAWTACSFPGGRCTTPWVHQVPRTWSRRPRRCPRWPRTTCLSSWDPWLPARCGWRQDVPTWWPPRRRCAPPSGSPPAARPELCMSSGGKERIFITTTTPSYNRRYKILNLEVYNGYRRMLTSIRKNDKSTPHVKSSLSLFYNGYSGSIWASEGTIRWLLTAIELQTYFHWPKCFRLFIKDNSIDVWCSPGISYTESVRGLTLIKMMRKPMELGLIREVRLVHSLSYCVWDAEVNLIINWSIITQCSFVTEIGYIKKYCLCNPL